jgi:ribose 5-phosphate isomerase
VIDAPIPQGSDARRLNDDLMRIDGVLGHGLFLREADEVLVESHDRASVRRLTRVR